MIHIVACLQQLLLKTSFGLHYLALHTAKGRPAGDRKAVFSLKTSRDSVAISACDSSKQIYGRPATHDDSSSSSSLFPRGARCEQYCIVNSDDMASSFADVRRF